MNRIYKKLVAMVLSLVVSVSMMVMASYAWLVLSQNPAVTGIQIAIGGSNTIMIAEDIKETSEDGAVYHYPGVFFDKLQFSQKKGYAYLQEVGSLMPVSTWDGLSWYLPTYYVGSDEAVENGLAAAGQLKDTSDFILDNDLSHANLPAEESEAIREGRYVYLDFWVVSPGADAYLRVTAGDEDTAGSFVMEWPEAESTADGYRLSGEKSSVAATARVGFLANENRVFENMAMVLYERSSGFDSRFTSLKGVYQEPGEQAWDSDSNHFTIYEPNGDYHPYDVQLDGTYVETKALASHGSGITELALWDRLTVQRNSLWMQTADGEIMLEQIFQTALRGMDTEDRTGAEITTDFYTDYLQGQVHPYVDRGEFIGKTSSLYEKSTSGSVGAEALDAMESGATDDVYIIALEKNVPQRIRMFVWLEGQDVDCTGSAGSSSLVVNIELAGGDS